MVMSNDYGNNISLSIFFISNQINSNVNIFRELAAYTNEK